MEKQSICPYPDSLVDACVWCLDELKYARAAIAIALYRGTLRKDCHDQPRNELGRWVSYKAVVDRYNSQVLDTQELTDILWANTTKHERKSLRAWTSGLYIDINNYLRYNTPVAPGIQKLAGTIQTALSKCRLPHTIITRRNVPTGYISELAGGETWLKIPRCLKKIELLDKGFMATTPVAGGGIQGNVAMYLTIPKGTHGAYIESVALEQYKHEKELLLQKGSKVKVLAAYKEGDTYTIVGKVIQGDNNDI